MAEAIGHPDWGYYTSRIPFGRKGDFITSPEISQMFGELLGLWCGDIWQQMNQPKPFLLVELGPGRGTLMKDVLRALRIIPNVSAAVQVHLVETSPLMRAQQKEMLADYPATWHEHISEVPLGPILVIANEFLDALPIHQFERTDRGWAERLVGLQDNGSFCFVPGTLQKRMLPEFVEAPVGAVIEVSPASLGITQEISSRIKVYNGAALFVDYGYSSKKLGDTLRAVQKHRELNIFEDPGRSDLSSHVDFRSIAKAAVSMGTTVYGPIEQGIFLRYLGITERSFKLKKSAPLRATIIDDEVARLTSPKMMGSLFKVLAILNPSLPKPAGFP